MITREQLFGYQPDTSYSKAVAYFSMEFAIHQALKIYSGGLGFLAGSHMRSAYELKQNLIGVGMLWKFGYYDQQRGTDALMKPFFTQKDYSFLHDTGVTVTVPVHNSPVHVKAFLLKPETFNSAPLLLLTTDIDENDYLARTISHRLYDPNESTRIAQSIVLGTAGAMVLDQLGLTPDVYHMNEGHSVSLNFYLFDKFKSLDEVKERVIFTTHTPEMAGNEEHSYDLLADMSFFYKTPVADVKQLLGLDGWGFNYTLGALKFARKANGVSQLHGQVARDMWGTNPGICPITAITNAQNKKYWADADLDAAIASNNHAAIAQRKQQLKTQLFTIVANQCGKLFKPDVLTVVWARRFAGYKRADLLMHHWERFLALLNNAQYPIQIIWAGKPYPGDYGAIGLFNHIMSRVRNLPNCAVLTGYELELSGYLKRGSDVWLNNPNMYREASGTSGMTAAMNGSINLSLPDGWVPEFARHLENCFLIEPAADQNIPQNQKDDIESGRLLDLLENTILPMYYTNQAQWQNLLVQAANNVVPQFESARMAAQYYSIMYNG